MTKQEKKDLLKYFDANFAEINSLIPYTDFVCGIKKTLKSKR